MTLFQMGKPEWRSVLIPGSVHGAVSDVASDTTAFGNRPANFAVSAIGANLDRLNEAWDEVYPFFNGLYLSFDTDLRPERIDDAFPPRTLERLRQLKERYDPDNVFKNNFNIEPQAHFVPDGAEELASIR